MRPGEQDLGGQERADAGLVEQLRSELADELVDLAGELALLERSGSARGERLARRASSVPRSSGSRRLVGARRGQAIEQPGPGQAAQLCAQRLRRGH